MALAEKAREAEVKAKEELAADANKHIDAILSGVKFLHENGLLPAKVATGFFNADGTPARGKPGYMGMEVTGPAPQPAPAQPAQHDE